MTKIVKSPKKQSAKITKLKMRVGEIANMLLQNNPKMVRMRSGGSSGYADLFMSKQLMKGGITDGTQGKIVEFLKEKNNKEAVQALKIKVINDDNANPEIKDELYKELYNYKLCDKYNDVGEGDLKDNLITLDIVNKFYLLVKDKKKDGDNVLKDEDIKDYDIKKPDGEGEPAAEGEGAAGQPKRTEAEIKLEKAEIKLKRLLLNKKTKEGLGNFSEEDEIKLEEAEAELAELQKPAAREGGKPPAKYKSTGRIVHIMYKKRNYKRTVYVKDKRNTKYCKIDGEYILLSKMKMIA